MTLICSVTTGMRRAKLLCSRTSRVSSSSRAFVTSYAFPFATSTLANVNAPRNDCHDDCLRHKTSHPSLCPFI
nr:MAG TPA: hypothetical protein [Caudoviricetes sp.]